MWCSKRKAHSLMLGRAFLVLRPGNLDSELSYPFQHYCAQLELRAFLWQIWGQWVLKIVNPVPLSWFAGPELQHIALLTNCTVLPILFSLTMWLMFHEGLWGKLLQSSNFLPKWSCSRRDERNTSYRSCKVLVWSAMQSFLMFFPGNSATTFPPQEH